LGQASEPIARLVGLSVGHTWQQIATIIGVTGLTDEAALVASGNLVVHA
jgi:hypothetical protein